VISLEELDKIGTEFSGESALHCQAGQAGLAGIIISAFPISLGGKTLKKKYMYLKKKTVKKKKRSLKKKKSLKNILSFKKKNKTKLRKRK
jgi:hypothetical protein